MLSSLTSILDLLKKLNDKTDIVEQGDIDEQYENLTDFKKLTTELDTLLTSFDTVDVKDGDAVEEKLFEFHRMLTTFEWHYSEISDLNFTLLKEYKDKIKESK